MKINPNLYDGPYKKVVKAGTGDGRYFDIGGKVKKGEKYIFSAKVKTETLDGIDETKSVTLAICDKTKQTFFLFYRSNIIDGKILFPFTGIDNVYYVLSYTGPYGNVQGRGITWYDVELIEGDKNNEVFIPSQDSLEPSKQAIFLAGGGYSRKCIHSSKFGGALC